MAVVTELKRAPESKRFAGITLLDPLPLLGAGDARRLALTTFHGCDILETWNCRPIAA